MVVLVQSLYYQSPMPPMPIIHKLTPAPGSVFKRQLAVCAIFAVLLGLIVATALAERQDAPALRLA